MRTAMIVILFISSVAFQTDNNAVTIYKKMIQTSEKVNTVKFDAFMIERFNGKNNLQKASLKVQHKPLKLYYYQHYPTEGIEILYCKGLNQDKALVKPNQFPWVNMVFDPYNKYLRTRQHHVILEPGFEYFIKVMKNYTDHYSKPLDEIIKFIGDEVLNGVKCYVISVNNPSFAYKTYSVKKGETIDDIAAKFLVNAYMILELNKDKVKSYKDVHEGDIITIPNYYAKKIVLYVDKIRYVPLKMVIYDDKGLYEMYEFKKMEINVSFKPDEFSPDFSEYGF